MGSTTAVSNKLDILASLPETQKDKGGSKSPVVSIDADLEAKLKEIGELKTAMKDAEGQLALLMSEALPVAEQMRRAMCVRDQKHLTSISLAGVAMLVVQNKYSAIPLSEEDRLRGVFGNFDECFQRKVTLTVDVEKLSAETVARLVQDGAATKCEILKPTEFLHAARSTDPNMGALCDSSGLRPVSFLKF